MRCNGLPNAYDPGDLRKYIHMWQLECDRYNENEQNWLLRTDERTILTQNRNIGNDTRVYLQQQQPNLGDLYAKRTYNVLGVCNFFLSTLRATIFKFTFYVQFHRFLKKSMKVLKCQPH